MKRLVTLLLAALLAVPAMSQTLFQHPWQGKRVAYFGDDQNWQPREDYTNKCGEYIDAYVQSVKEAGNLWAVPVIDLNALCGLYPLMDEQGQFFNDPAIDRLHPNNEGHRRMALTIMQQLLALPVF